MDRAHQQVGEIGTRRPKPSKPDKDVKILEPSGRYKQLTLA
jgi:hypothetical protein